MANLDVQMTVLGPAGDTIAVVNPSGFGISGLGTGLWQADLPTAGW
jgi:hypothetical protein